MQPDMKGGIIIGAVVEHDVPIDEKEGVFQFEVLARFNEKVETALRELEVDFEKFENGFIHECAYLAENQHNRQERQLI